MPHRDLTPKALLSVLIALLVERRELVPQRDSLSQSCTACACGTLLPYASDHCRLDVAIQVLHHAAGSLGEADDSCCDDGYVGYGYILILHPAFSAWFCCL